MEQTRKKAKEFSKGSSSYNEKVNILSYYILLKKYIINFILSKYQQISSHYHIRHFLNNDKWVGIIFACLPIIPAYKMYAHNQKNMHIYQYPFVTSRDLQSNLSHSWESVRY